MRVSKPLFFLFLFSIFLISSCGSGGGGGGDSGSTTPPPESSPPDVDISQLTGSWFGTFEDHFGEMHTLSITVSGTSITSISNDGVVTGVTGTITKKGGQLFGIVFSDDSVGAIIVDTAGNYAAVLDDEFSFGVIQKGADSLPVYLIDDINGTWSGVVMGTADFISYETATLSATCSSQSCPYTVSNGVTGTVFFTTSFNSVFGRWIGTYTNSLGTSGEARGFLSADKLFAAVWACATGGFFPINCDFVGMQKQ